MREIVFDVLQTENELTIYDSKTINWSDFKFSNKFKIHKLSEDDILRPYLISSLYYDSIDYEDIILIINSIEDIFDVIVETEIKIPDLQEIKDFILENKK